MSDVIEIVGIRAFGHHGVLPEERRDGQEFVVDVALRLDTRAAALSDEVGDTVHYGEVAEAVVGVVAGDPVDLIETLAARVADAVLAWPLVDAARVTIHKPHAPIPVPFDDVRVTIDRHRGEL